MKSFQVLEKQGIQVAVDLESETASDEIKALKQQGFQVWGDVVKAINAEVALKVYLAGKPKQKSNTPWVVLLLSMVVALSALVSGYRSGSDAVRSDNASCAFMSISLALAVKLNGGLDSVVDEFVEDDLLPIYKQGYEFGVRESLNVCLDKIKNSDRLKPLMED